MSTPLCLLCSKPFVILKHHAGPKQKRFCTEACNVANCNSISLVFADVAEDGVPEEGERVTSENGCPVSP
jgi:hypothetical protein